MFHAELSAAGEQYVDVEIKRALFVVKQMKETMGKKEEKHRHLIDALRYSRDKKKVIIVFLWWLLSANHLQTHFICSYVQCKKPQSKRHEVSLYFSVLTLHRT